MLAVAYPLPLGGGEARLTSVSELVAAERGFPRTGACGTPTHPLRGSPSPQGGGKREAVGGAMGPRVKPEDDGGWVRSCHTLDGHPPPCGEGWGGG